MLYVKAKGFAVTKRLEDCTFKCFGKKFANLEFKNLPLTCDIGKSYFISEVY